MTIEITRTGTNQLSDTRSTVAPRNNGADAARTSSGTAQSSPQDVVNITDTATRLSQIENQLSAVPVVNDQRVSEVRGALNSGNFDINPERVADKIISFELDSE